MRDALHCAPRPRLLPRPRADHAVNMSIPILQWLLNFGKPVAAPPAAAIAAVPPTLVLDQQDEGADTDGEVDGPPARSPRFRLHSPEETAGRARRWGAAGGRRRAQVSYFAAEAGQCPKKYTITLDVSTALRRDLAEDLFKLWIDSRGCYTGPLPIGLTLHHYRYPEAVRHAVLGCLDRFAVAQMVGSEMGAVLRGLGYPESA